MEPVGAVTRKHPVRGAAVKHAVDEATVRAHLSQAEPLLAAAALLPGLDRAALEGHGPSGLAADLVRLLLEWHDPKGDLAATGDRMAEAVSRLTTLAAEQDVQVARLQAMLEAVL